MVTITLPILLSLSSLGLARHAKPVSFGQPLLKREVEAAATTTTLTKWVTATTVLTKCAGSTPTGIPRISTTTRPTTATTVGGTRTSTTTSPSSLPSDSNSAVQQGNFWVLDSQKYRNRKVYTFNGNSLPEGLEASSYTVEDNTPDHPQIPYNHTFDPSLVQVSDGFLNLLVPGGQQPSPPTPGNPAGTAILCSEVVTTDCNIKYASVSTKAILSKVPGTCHGFFSYKDDTNEVDIEVLTDPESFSNKGTIPRAFPPVPIWYTNQATVAGNQPTNDVKDFPAGADPYAEVHEYRIDWTPFYTKFFFDGVEQAKFTSNIPTKAGHWIWNNWANGDPGKS